MKKPQKINHFSHYTAAFTFLLVMALKMPVYAKINVHLFSSSAVWILASFNKSCSFTHFYIPLPSS